MTDLEKEGKEQRKKKMEGRNRNKGRKKERSIGLCRLYSKAPGTGRSV